MRSALLLAMGAIGGAAIVAVPGVAAHLRAVLRTPQVSQGMAGSIRAHTEERFSFIANAPMERVAPLFGADKERAWAPGWDPQFVYPMPAADVRGMVFTVAHGHRKSVWVNTQLDWKNGRVQYVYVIPDALATLITLQITAEGNKTRVDVEYNRTALSAEADMHVREMAEKDRAAGPEWERQIGESLAKKQ